MLKRRKAGNISVDFKQNILHTEHNNYYN